MSNPNELLSAVTIPVTTNIRDLIVHLHRGNRGKAESIVADVVGQLEGIMQSGMDPQCSSMLRAQQTTFAIDEVRGLLSQGDLSGAVDAARDAKKEWEIA